MFSLPERYRAGVGITIDEPPKKRGKLIEWLLGGSNAGAGKTVYQVDYDLLSQTFTERQFE